MNRDELKKVLVVEKILDGQLTNMEGATVLGLTTRQIIRLKKRYQAEGAKGIIHKNRGRKPVHALSPATKESVAALYTGKYQGSNNCHFAELLEEHESLKLNSSSVRRILLGKGIKQAKPRRRSKVHQPRERKPQAGMLWQIDATPFAWLEDRAPAFALHAAIDDATGTVAGAVFRPTECLEGYSLVMQQGINAFGIPLGLYSDRHTIFRSPNEKLTVEQELAGDTKPLSNFGKAMAELHIEHIKAVTPQAKGRVERLWVTLQDRLTIELRLLGVTTLEDANKALPALIKKHNTQFAVKPRKSQSAYFPLDKAVNLDHVFATRHIRQLGHGITLSFANRLFTLAKPSRIPFHAKMAVEVRQTLSGQVILWHHGEALELRVTEKQKPEPKKKKAGSASPRKPAANHPWRNGWSQNQVQRSTKSSTNQVT